MFIIQIQIQMRTELLNQREINTFSLLSLVKKLEVWPMGDKTEFKYF